MSRLIRFFFGCFLSAGLCLADAPNSPPPEITPVTPRDFYNAGTTKLQAGKLREAEAFLESALSSQIEALQPPALYNLGHVRFAQGMEELKKGPGARNTNARARNSGQQADEAIRTADAALASKDIDKMVMAYMHGKGVRKELKAATAAVRRALEAHGKTLTKWQRSEGDFKSTLELHSPDTDAQHNAEVVDRCIAKLVDSLRELEQMANAMGEKQQKLGEKMKELKGQIPEPKMPPGASGDDDEEEEDKPFGPEPGQKEGAGKEGQEMSLSPEQAGWLLEGFKLDSERKLPMGQNGTSQPKERSRPTW